MEHDGAHGLEPYTDPLEVTFGRRVAELRRSRSMTQTEVAQAMTDLGHPTHQTTVAKIEKATRPTPVGEIGALATVFDVPVAELFLGSDADDHALHVRALQDRARLLQAEHARIEATLAEVLQQLAEARSAGR